MTIAVRREMRARLASGGSPASGRSSRSKTDPSAALSGASTRSGNVAEAFQLLLDVFLGVRFLEQRDLLLEAMRDELLDRRVAREVGVALHLGEERLVEFDAGAEHDHFSFWRGKSWTPNSATIAAASDWRFGACFDSARLANSTPGTASGSMQ